MWACENQSENPFLSRVVTLKISINLSHSVQKREPNRYFEKKKKSFLCVIQAQLSEEKTIMTTLPRIAIAGGGLCGLTLASAIAHRVPCAQIKVFERSRADRDQGYGLDLDENGHEAIAMAGLTNEEYWGISRERSDVMKTYPIRGDRPLFVKHLHPCFARWIAAEPETNRLELREALLKSIARSGAAASVHHEVAATSVRECVQSDGMGSTAEVIGFDGESLGEFDLVVDAAGLHSPLRAHRVTGSEIVYEDRILIHGLLLDPETSAPSLVEVLGEGTASAIGRGHFITFQRYGAKNSDHRTAMFYQVPSSDPSMVSRACRLPDANSRLSGTFGRGDGEAHLASVKRWIHQDMGGFYDQRWHDAVDGLDRVTVRPLMAHASGATLKGGTLPLVSIGDSLRNVGLGGGGQLAMQDVVDLVGTLLKEPRFDAETGRLVDLAALRTTEATCFERKESFVSKRDRVMAPLMIRDHAGSDPYIGSIGELATTPWWRVLLNLVGYISTRTYNPETAGSTPERFTKVNPGMSKWS